MPKFNRLIDRYSRPWSVLAVFALFCAASLPAQPNWKIIPLFRTDSMECQLRYLPEISQADTLWVETIFINHTPRPQKLGLWQMFLRGYSVDPKTGDWGEMSTFNTLANNGPRRPQYLCDYGRHECIPPNDTLFAGSALSFDVSADLLYDEIGPQKPALGQPDRRLRLSADVMYHDFTPANVSVQMQSDTFFLIRHCVRESDLPILRAQLEYCLDHAESRSNSRLLGRLLTDPRIYKALPLEKYNTALMGLDNSYARQYLLRFLLTEYPENEVLLQYVLDGIRKGERPVLQLVDDGFWKDTLVEPLVTLAETSDFCSTILQILNRHPAPWEHRPEITGRLSNMVRSRYVGLAFRDSLDSENTSAWVAASEALCMARDTGAIRYLEPALRDTQVFRVYAEYDFDRTPQYLPPTRICDYVYCKICTLRGIDVRKRVYEASGMSEAEIYRHLSNFRDPLSLNNRDCMIRIWDKLIAEYLSEK